MTAGGVVIGGSPLPAGTYTLYSIPTDTGLTLIVNKKAGGMPNHDQALDVVHVSAKRETPPAMIDPFRIWFEPSKKSSVLLRIGWEDRSFSFPISSQ
jgi:hypothetical protein